MSKVLPVFRIFDYAKAIQFYIDWLGFKIDWEHKPEHAPVFIQVSLRDITLRLSEHHGDACPGALVTVEDFTGLKAYHQQLLDKNYKYNRPGLDVPEWDPNTIQTTVSDPFGNRITFSEVPAVTV